MTYGWAILVIAVVLAALYSLGIFNPNSFAPKASAGSCEVVRPFGPTTSTDVHLEGTCTNMLPKYVAYFTGTGFTSDIKTPLYFPLSNTINFSVVAWISPASTTPNCNYCGIVDAENGIEGWGLAYWNGGSMDFWINGLDLVCRKRSIVYLDICYISIKI